MKYIHSVGILFAALTLMSCGGKTSTQQADAQAAQEYVAASQSIARTQSVVNELQNAVAQGMTLTAEQLLEICTADEQLVFDYDPAATQDSAGNARCQALQQQIRRLHQSIHQLAEAQTPKIVVTVYNKEQELINTTQNYPVYLERGEKMLYTIDMERAADVRIYNADNHQLLKSYATKAHIADSMDIPYRAIYLVQITPKGHQYADVRVGYKTHDLNRLSGTKPVRVDSVEAKKGDFLAAPIPGIKMTKLFEEPRKFTLRGQIKAAFSGSSRAIVALQVYVGTTDVLYSLRISTNEGDQYSDGRFYDNMDTYYRRIKILGLPVYDGQRGSGLIGTLLGLNIPPREEDAYINMYVFYNAAQAKKFQDGEEPSKLSYSVDYSTMGTQSCNGRIPTKGNRTIYLGFLNERMRYNNYVWLEGIGAVPTTEYVRPTFTVQ